MNYNIILAQATTTDPGLALGAGGTQTATGTPTEVVVVQDAAAGGLFGGGMNMWSFLIMYGAIIAIAWLMLIRPQRRQQKQMREMQEALKVGDNIITASGTYGTIVENNEETFLIEFGSGKSVRIPVAKNQVVGVKEPK